MWWIWIPVGVFAIFMVVLFISLCKVASFEDEQMEEAYAKYKMKRRKAGKW